MTAEFPDVCVCRPGRMCDRCVKAHRRPAAGREPITMTDDVRNELRLLGMTDMEIEEMAP